MTIRQDIEAQLKEAKNMPDQSQIKNELIEACKWTSNQETSYRPLTFEDGVEHALRWVLGLEKHSPIQEEYDELLKG